jgi:hypothetical protein
LKTELTDDVSGTLKQSIKRLQRQLLTEQFINIYKTHLAANERSDTRRKLLLPISRGSNPATAHTTGYIDNLGQIRQDAILKKLVELSTLPTQERQAAMSRMVANN